MAKINVLIFPAGEINSVELHDALSSCVNVKVFGASSVERHGKYIFQNYISNVPMINSPVFFDKFNEILTQNEIDIIFPTHDTVADFFSTNQDKIYAKIVVADQKTAAICRDKEKTYQLFKNYNFCPKIHSELIDYPVFIKPKQGQGSVGARLINKPDELPADLNDYVICEYLPGIEYTVDCLTDLDGKLLFISPRSRQRMMAGVTVAGQNEKLTKNIEYIANIINEKLTFKGLWWFQIKKNSNDNWKLLEISTRCAGTMCLTRAKGINLPLLSVYILMGYQNITIINNPYNIKMDRTLISRYEIDYKYKIAYVDFDDTVTLNDGVNLKVMWFLYQCQNLGIKVNLITKHSHDIYITLNKLSISVNLFNEIIKISEDEHKADYINPEQAIFIDNSYNERIDVSLKLGIPVFDVDNIDVLMNWRV